MAIFRFFQDGGRRHLGFLKFQRAKFCQVGQIAAEIWRVFDFLKWRPPPSCILKFQIFNGRNGQEGRAASARQI